MSFFLSYADYLKKQVDNIQDYAQDIADVTKDFVCETWNDYPDVITKNKSLPISLVRGFMNKVCDPSNPPPPYVPPGCVPLYHVYGTFISKNSSAGGCDVIAYWRTKTPLDISNNLDTTPQLSEVGIWYIERLDGGAALLGLVSKTQFDSNSFHSMGSGNLVRFRGEAETCLNITQPSYGYDLVVSKEVIAVPISEACNEQIVYPPTTPPTIVNKTVNIGIENNVQTQNIEIVNNDNDSFSFPITVNIGGQLNVTLDLGGFTFDFGGGNPDGQGGNGEETEIPKPITPTPSPDVDVTIKQPFVPDKFVEVKPTDDPETPAIEDEEIEEIEVEDAAVKWVLIEVTTLPPQGKTIVFANPENNDYFAGYFHWQVSTPTGVYKMPAEPIRKQKNAYLAPIEAIGYSAYTVNGAKIKLTQYNQKPVES